MSLIFILIRISPCRAQIDRLVLTNYMEVNSKFSMLLKELRVFAMAYYSLCFSKKKKDMVDPQQSLGHTLSSSIFYVILAMTIQLASNEYI